MAVKLSNLPAPPTEYAVEFPKLDGGLNLLELDYRMDANESPEMVNLWWRDGALCSRDGQTRLTPDKALGTGFSAYEALFHGRGFFHIGDALWYGRLSDPDAPAGELALTKLCGGVPREAGAWFRYGDKLYYKNPGSYLEIRYDGKTDGFAAGSVTPFSPVTLINCEPGTCAGDVYQPENRICPQKTVWYTAAQEEDPESKKKVGVTVYHLPVQDVDSVDKVVVDEAELAEGTGYTVDLKAGTVTFKTAPKFHDPVSANTVRITYSKQSPDALKSILDCRYAAVFGGNQNVCVVLAGSEAQPNAYFWCGNHMVMDPGYFPVEQYNLAGSADEAITGFGKQQNMLVVFKEHSVGRASFETAEMGSGRVLLSMPYTAINARVGCDLPGSIQLIENNLVFANTEQGVHLVRDSSAAYENNIVCLSRKVNGNPLAKGLLKMVREGLQVCSFDDGDRYWLVADGEVYAWDYNVSSYSDPSWFYFTGVPGVAFLSGDAASYHLDGLGRVSILRRNFQDYGEGIPKRYRFAAQHFGNYDRLKDVLRCVFVVRGDTDTVIHIEYDSDYGRREDLTPIRAYSWRLSPRNLAYRFLGVTRFAVTAVRKPRCRHVRHFAMELFNDAAGMDMSVISAAVYYRFQGRDK